MSGDWRRYRPAIWMAMLGIALMLLLSPAYIGAVLLGASIGIAIRVHQRQGPAPAGGARRSRRRP
jgi:hypothetical protein